MELALLAGFALIGLGVSLLTFVPAVGALLFFAGVAIIFMLPSTEAPASQSVMTTEDHRLELVQELWVESRTIHLTDSSGRQV